MVALEIFKSRWAFTPKQRWPATLTLIKSRSVVENPSRTLSRHYALCYSGKKGLSDQLGTAQLEELALTVGTPHLPCQGLFTLLYGKSETKSIWGLAAPMRTPQCPPSGTLPQHHLLKSRKIIGNRCSCSESGKHQSFGALLSCQHQGQQKGGK